MEGIRCHLLVSIHFREACPNRYCSSLRLFEKGVQNPCSIFCKIIKAVWHKIGIKRLESSRFLDILDIVSADSCAKTKKTKLSNVWSKIVERPPKKSEEYKQLQSRPVQRSTWLFPQQSSRWAQNWNTHTWSHWCDERKSNKLFGIPVWKEDRGLGPLRHQLCGQGTH